MQSNHPTHLLYIEPITPPTAPIVDTVTSKVATILATLTVKDTHRGSFYTSCGNSSNIEWSHPCIYITAHDLALYYVQYHRAQISTAQLKNIDRLYDAVTDADYYSKIWSAGTHYFSVYRMERGVPQTMILKVVAGKNASAGINDLLSKMLYDVISFEEFDKIVRHRTGWKLDILNCEKVLVFDIL